LAERTTACALLRAAAVVYDQDLQLATAARAVCRGGFAAGGRWMALALHRLRGRSLPGSRRSLHVLGMTKYLLATTPAAAAGAAALAHGRPWGILAAIAIFYAVEVQMLFLFPAALDGSASPFSESRRLLLRAGGTLTAMIIVTQLAASMIFGGLVGRGFLRSWCLGCLAVCLWYEALHAHSAAPPLVSAP
jgi:hypothetical protein